MADAPKAPDLERGSTDPPQAAEPDTFADDPVKAAKLEKASGLASATAADGSGRSEGARR